MVLVIVNPPLYGIDGHWRVSEAERRIAANLLPMFSPHRRQGESLRMRLHRTDVVLSGMRAVLQEHYDELTYTDSAVEVTYLCALLVRIAGDLLVFQRAATSLDELDADPVEVERLVRSQHWRIDERLDELDATLGRFAGLLRQAVR